MRNNPTLAEKKMWDLLRKNFKVAHFARQKPLDNFIVDFFCNEFKLIIEVDGEVHTFQKEKDLERDNLFLVKYNLVTIRFSNDMVLKEPKSVILEIEKYIRT